MTHKFHPSIIRAYDIRGIYGQTLHDKDAFYVAKSFASFLKKSGKKKISVACDGRLSSPSLKAELIKDKIGIENIKISDIKVSKEECKEQIGKLLEDNVSIEFGFQEKDFDNMLNQESESIASVNDAINNKDNCDNCDNCDNV